MDRLEHEEVAAAAAAAFFNARRAGRRLEAKTSANGRTKEVGAGVNMNVHL